MVGSWPTAESLTTRVLTALETIAENSANEDKRSAARKILETASGDGRAALAGAIGSVLASGVG